MLLSQYVEVHHAMRLMTEFAGAVGYLLKDRVSDLAAFGTDVRRVAEGHTVIDPDLVARLFARRRERDLLAGLTDRERAVLALMAQGLSNPAIAGNCIWRSRPWRPTSRRSSPSWAWLLTSANTGGCLRC